VTPPDEAPPTRDDPAHVPTRIGQKGARHLEIAWADGHTSLYDVRELRLACACASCIDEWSGRGMLDPATVPDDVHPERIEPVGRYALQFAWSDGHTTGIYPFARLRELGQAPSASAARTRAPRG
jgi:ATP-binding protein involved in chromosome partitioning